MDLCLKASPEAFVFLNVRGAPLTRFGIHILVVGHISNFAT
jgi:hypothetical protein